MIRECQHHFVFQGSVYSHTTAIPGSGATVRVYEDAYYCDRCLEMRYANKREHGNSYQNPLEGTMPK